jgi:NTE family protein
MVGLVNAEKLEKFLTENLFGSKTFEDCLIPLHINATDIEKGREIVFRKGKIIDAVMASIAIPGIFPPRMVKNKILVDGGLVNNIPVSLVQERILKNIFVCDVGIPLQRPLLYRKYLEKKDDFWARSKMLFEPVLMDYFFKCFDVLRASQEETRLSRIPPKNILTMPHEEIGYQDFHKGEKIYKLGRETAEKKWEKI